MCSEQHLVTVGLEPDTSLEQHLVLVGLDSSGVSLGCVPFLAYPQRHTRLRRLFSRCTSVHLMFDSTLCSLALPSLFVGSCLTAFRFCILVECMFCEA